MATVPSPPLLGLYNGGGAFPTPGPSAWNSGPTTNFAAEYFDFESGSQTNVAAFISKCNANSLMPFVELEPWLYTANPATAVPLTAITGGSYDTFLTAVGTAIAGSARPVMITWGHEFNIAGQYPWAYSLSGSPYSGNKGSGPGGAAPTAAQWLTAWKYVRSKVNSTANNNALWMWACNVEGGGVSPAAYYPGTGFLDMAGIDGYPGEFGAPGSFTGDFGSTISVIRGLGWTGGILVSETNLPAMVASGGDSLATFVASMYAAGCIGVLEYEEDGGSPPLPKMTSTQWSQYNAAIAAHFTSTPPPVTGTSPGGLLMVGIA